MKPTPPKKAKRTGILSKLFKSKKASKKVKKEIQKSVSWEDILKKVEKNNDKTEYEIIKAAYDDHKIFIESPLAKNLYFSILVFFILAITWNFPDYYQHIVYGIIALVFGTALYFSLKDSIFFHLEAGRLHNDAEQLKSGEKKSSKPKFTFLKKLIREKAEKEDHEFDSKLLRIHYQNVLRTFMQGERKSWVDQAHSLTDLQTRISQGGMKLVWTSIDVLPQLGLIGTLAGLITMLRSFNLVEAEAQMTIMSGFALALGTTIVSNICVLILRPMFMQNERTMNQIFATLEGLMATFILPTQQQAMKTDALWNKNRKNKPTTTLEKKITLIRDYQSKEEDKAEKNENLESSIKQVNNEFSQLVQMKNCHEKTVEILGDIHTTLVNVRNDLKETK